MALAADLRGLGRSVSAPELAFLLLLLDLADAALDAKELAWQAARKNGIVDPEAAADAEKMRERLLPYASAVDLNGRRQAGAIFEGLLRVEADEVVAKVGGDVITISRGFRLGPDTVDFALWHESGAMTLVNVAVGADSAEVSSVARAAWYAVSAGLGSELTIRPALAALGEENEDTAVVCRLADVLYLPLGDAGFHRIVAQVLQMAVTGWPKH